MNERKTGGVQKKPPGGMPVEAVAAYRSVQSDGRGAVNAQLVGAASERNKVYKSTRGSAANHAEEGPRGFATAEINLLIRPVERVGIQRKIYFAAVSGGQSAVNQSRVVLADSAVEELLLQRAVSFGGLGGHNQARSVHVEAVSHDRSADAGTVLAY